MSRSAEIKLIGGLLVVAVVVLVLCLRPAPAKEQDPPGPDPRASRALLIPAGLPARGRPDAPYTLVEIGDLQCPLMKTNKPDVDAMLARYADRMNLVMQFFQTSPSHGFSPLLSAATVAAGEQGKFWEMRDRILQGQDRIGAMKTPQVTQEMLRYARELKLDLPRFRKALKSKQAAEPFQRGVALASQLKFYGGPGFYLVPPAGPPIRLRFAEQMKTWLSDPDHLK